MQRAFDWCGGGWRFSPDHTVPRSTVDRRCIRLRRVCGQDFFPNRKTANTRLASMPTWHMPTGTTFFAEQTHFSRFGISLNIRNLGISFRRKRSTWRSIRLKISFLHNQGTRLWNPSTPHLESVNHPSFYPPCRPLPNETLTLDTCEQRDHRG